MKLEYPHLLHGTKADVGRHRSVCEQRVIKQAHDLAKHPPTFQVPSTRDGLQALRRQIATMLRLIQPGWGDFSESTVAVDTGLCDSS